MFLALFTMIRTVPVYRYPVQVNHNHTKYLACVASSSGTQFERNELGTNSRQYTCLYTGWSKNRIG